MDQQGIVDLVRNHDITLANVNTNKHRKRPTVFVPNRNVASSSAHCYMKQFSKRNVLCAAKTLDNWAGLFQDCVIVSLYSSMFECREMHQEIKQRHKTATKHQHKSTNSDPPANVWWCRSPLIRRGKNRKTNREMCRSKRNNITCNFCA